MRISRLTFCLPPLWPHYMPFQHIPSYAIIITHSLISRYRANSTKSQYRFCSKQRNHDIVLSFTMSIKAAAPLFGNTSMGTARNGTFLSTLALPASHLHCDAGSEPQRFCSSAGQPAPSGALFPSLCITPFLERRLLLFPVLSIRITVSPPRHQGPYVVWLPYSPAIYCALLLPIAGV